MSMSWLSGLIGLGFSIEGHSTSSCLTISFYYYNPIKFIPTATGCMLCVLIVGWSLEPLNKLGRNGILNVDYCCCLMKGSAILRHFSHSSLSCLTSSLRHVSSAFLRLRDFLALFLFLRSRYSLRGRTRRKVYISVSVMRSMSIARPHTKTIQPSSIFLSVSVEGASSSICTAPPSLMIPTIISGVTLTWDVGLPLLSETKSDSSISAPSESWASSSDEIEEMPSSLGFFFF